MKLASQDDGSGRLTNWYRKMGFSQVGRSKSGTPLLEAPLRPSLAAAVQARMALPWSSRTIQRASTEMEIEIPVSVEVEKSGDAVPLAKFSAIKAIVDAAIAKAGKERRNADLTVLETILSTDGVKGAKPKNSEGTYALGKHDTSILSTGSGTFESEVEENTPLAYTVKKLGNREDFIHGETTIVKDSSAVTAVAATQLCCLFCYGFLELKGIGHQALRPSPFPKGWIHPSGTFTLKQVNPSNGPKGGSLMTVPRACTA